MQQVRTIEKEQLVSLFSGFYLLEVESDSIGYTTENKIHYTNIYQGSKTPTSWQLEVNGGHLVLPEDIDFFLLRICDFQKIDFKQIS